LEKIHYLFEKFVVKFEACKDYSVYFYELLINNRISVLDKYYNEYFPIEE